MEYEREIKEWFMVLSQLELCNTRSEGKRVDRTKTCLRQSRFPKMTRLLPLNSLTRCLFFWRHESMVNRLLPAEGINKVNTLCHRIKFPALGHERLQLVIFTSPIFKSLHTGKRSKKKYNECENIVDKAVQVFRIEHFLWLKIQ